MVAHQCIGVRASKPVGHIAGPCPPRPADLPVQYLLPAPNVRPVSTLQRETSSCDSCGSTLRYRGVIHALSVSLFGKCLAIQDFPERQDIVGWGMTDWEAYAVRLSKKFSYTNTFYHTQPFP